jgi:hypothetical protein
MVTLSPIVFFALLKLKLISLHVSEGGKAGGQGTSSSIRVISGEFSSRDMMGQAGTIARGLFRWL